MTTSAPTTKYCPSCQTTKSSTDFYKKKAGENGGTQYECKRCQLNRRRVPGAPTRRRAIKTPKPVKPSSNGGSDTAELIVDIPGIWEIQNRGKGYTSYNFTSLIDDSTFSFPTFREARQARQSMMDAFRQQALYASTHRQSTGRPAACDDEVDDDDE